MRHSIHTPSAGVGDILLVDSGRGRARRLAPALEARGWKATGCADWDEARHRLRFLPADIVVGETATPAETAACGALLADRGADPSPVAVLALTAATAGPADRPDGEQVPAGAAQASSELADDELLARISAVREAGAQDRGAASISRGARLEPGQLIGDSPAFQRVIEQVTLIAPKQTTVLITGETGTGKERVARALHRLSLRAEQPWVAVNCGGIPANLLEDEFFGHERGAFTDAGSRRIGRFEQAHRGTLFLDEIGDLPLELQPKLLRAVQEREVHRVGAVTATKVDVRIIAATNADLASRVDDGGFREDLFYRINVFPIELPPLRERPQDIPLLVAGFLEKFCRREGLPDKRLDPAAEPELAAQRWPGNVRELENAVEIAVIRSGRRRTVDAGDFPVAKRGFGRARRLHPGSAPAVGSRIPAAPTALSAGESIDLKEEVARFERAVIERALACNDGNKSRAAQALQINRTTLVEKLKRLPRSRPVARAG